MEGTEDEKEFSEDVTPSEEVATTEETEHVVAEDSHEEVVAEQPQMSEEETHVDEPEPVVEAVVEEVEDIRPSADLTQPAGEETHEVLEELVEVHPEEVVAAHEPFEEKVHPIRDVREEFHPHTSGAHSAMSFNVEGDMKLDLVFHISGKKVHLNIKDGSFELELEGGMKFSIPLDETHSNKKAA